MAIYLDNAKVVERLIKEWEMHGTLVIAYDFDNTVYDYHKTGDTYEEIIRLLRDCKEVGAHLILFTARRDDEMDFVMEYLNSNNIPYDAINEDPSFIMTPGRKVYYNVLLDDRAGLPSTYNALLQAYNHMKNKNNSK